MLLLYCYCYCYIQLNYWFSCLGHTVHLTAKVFQLVFEQPESKTSVLISHDDNCDDENENDDDKVCSSLFVLHANISIFVTKEHILSFFIDRSILCSLG